jgi:hypothetical protein
MMARLRIKIELIKKVMCILIWGQMDGMMHTQL